ncbi:hypothetical protein EC988_007943, partial [Linderina pennispora]
MRLDEVNWAKLLPYSRGTEDSDFEHDFISQLQLYILGCDYMAVSALISQLD